MQVFTKISGLVADKDVCKEVKLVHDKDNKYSKNATKVMLGNKFLGWVSEKPEQSEWGMAEIVRAQGIKTARIASITLAIEVDDVTTTKEVKPNEEKPPLCDKCLGIKRQSKSGRWYCECDYGNKNPRITPEGKTKEENRKSKLKEIMSEEGIEKITQDMIDGKLL